MNARDFLSSAVPAVYLRVYSSAVERLTADQQVSGSNPDAPCASREGDGLSAFKMRQLNTDFEKKTQEVEV